jgi:hypothetical protein
VLSVTAVDALARGWVRVAPCDSTSTTSTLNMTGAGAVPNVAIVMPDADGAVCVTSSVATNLVIDRFLTFASTDTVAVAEPSRVLDTREIGAGTRLGPGAAVLSGQQLGVTPETTGVILNLTSTNATAAGFFTAYPCLAGLPPTSNLNFVANDIVANLVIVQPDSNGDVCVYSSAPSHVVVDVLGTTADGFGGSTPVRLLDTRISNLPSGWP